MKPQTEIYKVLKSALVEKDVENAYRTALLKAFDYINIEFASKYGTDGVAHAHKYMGENIDLILLIECKYNKNFKDRINIIEVLIQALYYLKMFEKFGDDLPHVIMVGDINECFCLHSNDLIKYLSYNLDWSTAPSSAAKKNPQLIKEMHADENILPYIFNVDKHFDFKAVIEKAIELSKDIVNFVRITEKNINRVFNEFVDSVLYSKKLTKQNANELVNIFISTIINPSDNYIHPKKPQTLVTKDLGNIRVHNDRFKAFFKHFQREYSPHEKDELVAICDRLIEDTTRRFQGEFFTPTEWVEEAHRMIESEFGEDWKEKYVVWDPAWGTGNLTRDYKFKELYASTLNEVDIGIARQRGYNPEATIFQFDFLNDPDEKLPDGLKKALEDKRPIIVFMNPPYGRSSGINVFGSIEKGSAETSVAQRMKEDKLGMSSSQLYTQFLYRCSKMGSNNINIATYSMLLYLSGESFKKFRNVFLKQFRYINGMIFQASNFSNVGTQWAIEFSIWKPGETECKSDFSHKIKDVIDGKIKTIAIKNVYNTDNKTSLNNFVNYTPTLKDYPKFSSGLIIKDTDYGYGIDKRSFSNLISHGNNIMESAQSVYIINGGISRNVGKISVNNTTFYKAISIFTARRSLKGNWINWNDEYIAPNIDHPDYKQWNNDCLIYSLFESKSNQASLRNIDYKNRKWDIINEWFWISNDIMLKLANEHKFDELYRDCKNFGGERFIYKKLPETELSDDASIVYNKACELVYNSFQYRQILHEEHPEYHLNTWDAGWYQIKLILKQFMPDELREFRKLYKEFEDRMREGVYKFGFLK